MSDSRLPLPTGDDDDRNNNKNNNRKRKERSYPSADSNQSEQNKRLNTRQSTDTPVMEPVQLAKTPVMEAPQQPGFGFGDPQMGSTAVSMAKQTTRVPSVAMGSLDVAPQYQNSQSQSQPGAQYLQQRPQPVYQPVEHQSGLNMELTPGFVNKPPAYEQRQSTPWEPGEPQCAGSSVQPEQKRSSIGLLRHQAIEMHTLVSGGTPIEISATGLPGKGHFITVFPDSTTSISIGSGKKGLDTFKAQYEYHRKMNHGLCNVEFKSISVPLMSSRLPDPHQPRQPSTSTENLVFTKKDDGRQTTENPQPQDQPPAQAHSQGQESLLCANCNRTGHLVGDCVGPPNRVHGDLPACPICDSFGGRVKNDAGHRGHRFDDCHHVQGMLRRHQWDTDRRIAYADLAVFTNDELLTFLRALVVKRVRKVPIRTKLLCWVDVLREATRRFHNADIITSLGNMTPWTKNFAIQQHNMGALDEKPWDFYDYAAGNTQSLPADPVEQVQRAWEHFVAKGLPDIPAQVLVK